MLASRAEGEMVGWHHQLNGHEFEQTPGDSGGQRTLVCSARESAESGTRLSNCRTRANKGGVCLASVVITSFLIFRKQIYGIKGEGREDKLG